MNCPRFCCATKTFIVIAPIDNELTTVIAPSAARKLRMGSPPRPN
jgi:hypothetical protein